MQQEPILITWPAILHYLGQAELAYIPSRQAWENEQKSHTLQFQTMGRLIDSTGRIFSLRDIANAQVETPASFHARPIPAEFVTLQEVIELLRAHAAQSASCCIAKISAPSIAAAIRLVDTI